MLNNLKRMILIFLLQYLNMMDLKKKKKKKENGNEEIKNNDVRVSPY